MRTILAVPVLFSAVAWAQSPATFTTTGSMNTARSQHTATLLANGKVLVTGGFSPGFPGNSLASAELYDPSTGAFTPTGDMITGHRLHRATLLADGRVLITGGIVAELYDPVTGLHLRLGERFFAERACRSPWCSKTWRMASRSTNSSRCTMASRASRL